MVKKIAIGMGIMCSLLVLMVVGSALNWMGGAAQVASEEFSAREMLRKYEWFKDASATLDKKRADIGVYSVKMTSLETDYTGVARKDWPRSDREALNQWRAEVAGVTASFNGLASEYNSQMSKFNWSFTNAGSLPKGATEVLPREYKEYM